MHADEAALEAKINVASLGRVDGFLKAEFAGIPNGLEE